jgi:hypothetical protein
MDQAPRQDSLVYGEQGLPLAQSQYAMAITVHDYRGLPYCLPDLLRASKKTGTGEFTPAL